MKYIFFFATQADIVTVLERFEIKAPIKFVETGTRATANRPIYLASCEIPQLGRSTHETGNASTTYMVSRRDTKNQMYVFLDDSGQKKWLLSNGDNEETTLLTPAGLWKTGTLLPGNMSTMHNTPVAQQLMRLFLSTLKQEGFRRIGIWWLGGEALAMLKAGKRLVQAEQSPPEFDLRWPEIEDRAKSTRG